MNLQIGFLRLWVVCSVLFIGFVGVFSFDRIRNEFVQSAYYESWRVVLRTKDGEHLIPVHCRDARGTSGIEYTGKEGPWSVYSTKAKCIYKIADFRRLFPEYNDLADDVLIRQMFKKSGGDPDNPHQPWIMLSVAAVWAFGVPLGALLFGFSMAWVVLGFSNRRRKF